tara:strand:- start:120 stop:284 length:165 start_codon:yes stop_codon:yes gene_type:complete
MALQYPLPIQLVPPGHELLGPAGIICCASLGIPIKEKAVIDNKELTRVLIKTKV